MRAASSARQAAASRESARNLMRSSFRLPVVDDQKRPRLAVPWKAIQKLTPSLQAPQGRDPAPVENVPIAVRSAALKRETVSVSPLVTRILWPSKATAAG